MNLTFLSDNLMIGFPLKTFKNKNIKEIKYYWGNKGVISFNLILFHFISDVNNIIRHLI